MEYIVVLLVAAAVFPENVIGCCENGTAGGGLSVDFHLTIKIPGGKTIGGNCTNDNNSTTPQPIYTGCSTGWSEFGGHCYKFFQTTLDITYTWSEAKEKCSSHGADLASIHSQKESDFVVSIGTHDHNHCSFPFIGLRNDNNVTKFYWSDGSKVDYNNIFKNEREKPRYVPGAYLIFPTCYGELDIGTWGSVPMDKDSSSHFCKKPFDK